VQGSPARCALRAGSGVSHRAAACAAASVIGKLPVADK
jgi:hypothetical protein